MKNIIKIILTLIISISFFSIDNNLTFTDTEIKDWVNIDISGNWDKW